MEEKNRKVLIIGLDGATFDLIKPWIAEGYLPNIERLVNEGCSGPLQSTLQPITAPAWTTFITGVNQGKHGLYNFVQRRADSYGMEVTNGTHNAAPTIFDIASQQNLRVAAVNIPYTFPPRAINGIMVGGPFTPVVSPQLVHPPEFFDTLISIAPNYFVMPDFDSQNADPLGDYADKLLLDIELREKLSLHLIQEEAWDLFMVVFMATDEAHHAYWAFMEDEDGSESSKYRQVIQKIYKRTDQAIGTILRNIPEQEREDTTIFIVSDHGGGPLRWMINLNRWLADEVGVLKFHDPRTNYLSETKANFTKWAAQTYRRYAPPKFRARFRNRIGAKRFEQVKGEVESVLFTSSVDWQNTKAYAMGAGGNIFINLCGREPSGIIEPGDEYEAICKQITLALMDLRDPENGKKIVKQVYRREDIYHGPFLEKAPDLLVEWADYTFWGRGRYDSRAPIFENHKSIDLTDIPLTGTHQPEGILIAHGSGIRVGAQIGEARLLDMAPTIMSLLSIAPSLEMDGNVLQNLLTPEEAQHISELSLKQTLETQAGEFQYTAEEEKIITDHLKALGYL